MLKILFLDTDQLNDKRLFEQYYNKVSSYRKKKINGYVNEKDKNLSLGAGILTDIFLASFGLEEKNMTYIENEYGKPFFAKRPDLHFNLSHSGHWTMAAFSDSCVGCDIEEYRAVKEDISRFVLSENEKAEDLIKIWVRKESYLKYRGRGLDINPTSFSAEDIKEIRDVDFIDGYCCAVCCSETDLHDCHIIKLGSVSGKGLAEIY